MIQFIDRVSKKQLEEKVYGRRALELIYGNRFIAKPLRYLTSRFSLFSSLFGFWQRLPFTKRKVNPFIELFDIDESEFVKDNFQSFDDFFTRKVKKRPLSTSPLIIPADGRYLFYPNIEKADGFLVKGEKFNLSELLQDKPLAKQYEHGSMVIARLAPVDYHRFHFPSTGIASPPRLINGYLYSVNPIALKQNIHIFSQNKRMITELESESFGKILLIEIGATNVGSIHQTFDNPKVNKGDEKGYFSFGASSIIMLFEPNCITFDPDLLNNSLEIRCLFGQSLGC